MTWDDPKVAEMVEISAPMVGNPLPWVSLNEDQQRVFRYLMPDPCFDEVQAHFLSLWWLPVTEQQLADLNALMPPNNVISARVSLAGTLYVGADLLSDALDGRVLADLLPIIETLPLNYAETITWEEPPPAPSPAP